MPLSKIFVDVIIEDLDRFDSDISVRRKVVNEGESVMLPCNPPASVPPAKIRWGLHVREEDYTPGRPLSLDERVQIDDEGRCH